MPCMGPSKEAAYAEGQVVYEDVLKYLQTKHHLLSTEYDCGFPNLLKSRAIVLDQLKEAVQEVVWQDHCESF